MPSKSKKQHDFMNAVAHSPSFAKKVGVPQSVGKDFSNADKSRKFKEGGDMKESKAMVKKEVGFMKKAGAPKSMIKHEMAEAKMAKGGMPMVMKDGKKMPAFAADGQGKMAKGGMTKMGAVKTGSTPDGVAVKGKTKGRQVAMSPAVVKATGMKRGGKTC
jgi:hypothetical protein